MQEWLNQGQMCNQFKGGWIGSQGSHSLGSPRQTHWTKEQIGYEISNFYSINILPPNPNCRCNEWHLSGLMFCGVYV